MILYFTRFSTFFGHFLVRFVVVYFSPFLALSLSTWIISFLKFSEENPDWCCNFITQNGLNAYVGLIDIFENDTEVVRKSMNMLVS